jgi:hypothetical protein
MPRVPFWAQLAMIAAFSAGIFTSFAIAQDRAGFGFVTTKGGPKPGAHAKVLGRAACADMRLRVGAARFVKTFRTAASCDAIMASAAQSAIVLCAKRYPPGSTADLYCIGLAIQSSPAERAAVAGLRITTGKTVTYIPVPTAGPGAGTGVGTGAGTGGGIPGSHRH